MQYQTFTAKVVCSQTANPYFLVPPEVRDRFGNEDGPLPVCGEVAGLAFRGVLWTEDDGQYFVELSPELSASDRFQNGVEVIASIAFDAEPREASIPYELTETLGMAPLAERAWEKLTERERGPFCEWVAAATDNRERWRRAERAAAIVRRGEKLEMTGHASAS